MHVMIDLESLSTRPDAAILQIAAVEFEPVPGGIVRTDRMLNVYLTRSGQERRAWDTRALGFWLTASEPARVALAKGLRGGVCMDLALATTFDWFTQNAVDDYVGVWAHGSVFDLGCLKHAFLDSGHYEDPPWGHRQERDTRTLYSSLDWDVAREAKAWQRAEERVLGRKAVAHDAADDVVIQACTVQEAMR